MANFKVHFLASAIMSSGFALNLHKAQIGFSSDEVALALGVGVIGGILPDIDLKESTPSKALFSVLALVCAGVAFWMFQLRVDLVTSLYVALAVGLGVKVIIHPLASSLTVHRGVFHSTLSAVMWGLVGVSIFYYLCTLSLAVSWVLGVILFFNYLLHLSIDELWSLLLLKKSLGTAIKIVSFKDPLPYIIVAIISLALIYLLPGKDLLIRGINQSLGI